MEMKREMTDGGTITPLFMSASDCEAEVQAEREAEDGDPTLETVILSLPSVVDHLLTVADGTPTFGFVPPSATTEHLNKYVGKGVYWRAVDDDDA